jgi:hypothetical protein
MKPITKQLADIITFSRVLLIPLILWLGLTRGQEAIPIVVVLMIYNWTADSLDGPLARRNPTPNQSWIGQRDLEIDMLISASVLGYLVSAALLPWPIAAFYILVWLLYISRKSLSQFAGIVFQVPIYGWLILVALKESPQVGLWLLAWVILAIVLTWPKLPKVILPDLISDLRGVLKRWGGGQP